MATTPECHPVGRILRGVVLTALAGILVFAGFTKALEPWAFFGNLRLFGFGVYPAAALAVLLPVLEVTLGCLLVFRRTQPAALVLCVMLGVAFVAVQVPVLLSGRSVPCGCLGSSQPVSGWTLARALVFLGAAAWACGYNLLAARSQDPPQVGAPLGVQPRPQ